MFRFREKGNFESMAKMAKKAYSGITCNLKSNLSFLRKCHQFVVEN